MGEDEKLCVKSQLRCYLPLSGDGGWVERMLLIDAESAR